MNDSKDPNKVLDALLNGELRGADAAEAMGRLAGDELEGLAELIDTLERVDPSADLPDEATFAEARHAVVDRITSSERARTQPRTQGTPTWLPIAAALATLAIGWVLGRSGVANSESIPELRSIEDLVALDVQSDTGAPRFRYTNLRLEEISDEAIAIQVDVQTELALKRSKNDPLLNEILASSVENDPSLGTRLKAVRHAPDSPRVRQALMAAVKADADVSVRLRALERLIDLAPSAPTTQDTLLEVLSSENSVAMRLLAIDGLSKEYLTDGLYDSIETGPDEGENALLWRVQQRLDQPTL